ncbi:MAG: hypothetical protein WCP63_09085 [Cyanobium sp. ELA712]
MVPFPPGEDPDSLLRSQGVGGLRACLTQGQHWLHWELDCLLADLHNNPADFSILQRSEREGAELLALLPDGALRRKAEQRLQEALGGLPPATHNTAQSGETKDQASTDTNVQQAERRALRLFLCNPRLREVLSVLELADPLHREAMGCLWCLQQRLAGRDASGAVACSDRSSSGEQGLQGDGLRAAVIAALPSMDPPLAQLLSPLLTCGEPVRVKLAAQPEPELMCILDVLEPVG